MRISIYADRFTQIAAPPGATISILNLVRLTFFTVSAAKLPATIAMADPPAWKRPSNYQQFDPATKKAPRLLRWIRATFSSSSSGSTQTFDLAAPTTSSRAPTVKPSLRRPATRGWDHSR